MQTSQTWGNGDPVNRYDCGSVGNFLRLRESVFAFASLSYPFTNSALRCGRFAADVFEKLGTVAMPQSHQEARAL